MSDFDGLIKDKEPEHPPQMQREKQAQPKIESKSLVEMLTEDGDVNTLGKKLNLDTDMTEKVLIPLVNFLDKYGVGESLSTNPTVNQGADLLSFFTDVAPVVKSAAEYFQGKKQTLSDEDAAFLDKIKEAQNTESFLFIGDELDDEGEVVEETVEPEPEPEPESPLTGTNPFIHGVDWNEVLQVPAQYKEKSGIYGTITQNTKPTEFGIQGLDKLAAEHGVSMSDVISSDRQQKTNQSGGGVDYTNDEFSLDLGLGEIKNAMQSEQTRLANTSKVNFEEELEVPTNIEEYDPMSIKGYVPPTISGLESVESLMKNANIDSFESPDEVTESDINQTSGQAQQVQPDTELETDEDSNDNPEAPIVEFTDDELVYNVEDNTYLNPQTGEVYEAIDDLTEVPPDYFGDETEE